MDIEEPKMINKYLNYLQENNSNLRISTNVLNMKCTNLPSEILNFARNWKIIRHNILEKRSETKRSKALTDIPPEKISDTLLNKFHVSSCNEIMDLKFDYNIDSSINLINEKLLFNFYEGSNYRTWGLTWYSFKDKKVYVCHDYADSNLFFRSETPPYKFIWNPIPFKEWFKKWSSDKNNFDMLDYDWLRQ